MAMLVYQRVAHILPNMVISIAAGINGERPKWLHRFLFKGPIAWRSNGIAWRQLQVSPCHMIPGILRHGDRDFFAACFLG